jgi:hypothetical protein
MTRRVTVEVWHELFSPARTLGSSVHILRTSLYSRGTDHIENTLLRMNACLQLRCIALGMLQTTYKTPLLLSELLCNLATSCSLTHREHSSYFLSVRWNMYTESLPSNGDIRQNVVHLMDKI